MSNRKKSVYQVNQDFYILKDAQAVVEVVGPQQDTVNGAMQTSSNANNKSDTGGFAYWGTDNLKPQRMVRLVAENHIKPQLLLASRDFVLGSRPTFFKRVITDGKLVLEPADFPQGEDWLGEIDAFNYLLKAGNNLEYCGNIFASISLDSSKKVDDIGVFDCTEARCGLKNPKTGVIERYFINPDWQRYAPKYNRILPAFDKKNPTRFGDFVFHSRDWMVGQPYYEYPAWWGTERWTEVSNLIPLFHRSGLKNGYNIKWHIQIPRDYFIQFGDADKQAAAERELISNLNKFLSGVENVDKAFVSKFAIDPNTLKPMPGWVIEPLKNNTSDGAYESVNNQANIAHSSGHGIDPSLAGIDTGSKLGGSGSEKRISTQIHIAYKTANKRRILLEPLNVAMKIMGFPKDMILGIEDVNIVTLAEDPKGVEKAVNQNAPK